VLSKLAIFHVVALRLYTTHAFHSLNDPLRDRGRHERGVPHKFPATVFFIQEGVKKLRAVRSLTRRSEGITHPVTSAVEDILRSWWELRIMRGV
jgi:hypothetical protein